MLLVWWLTFSTITLAAVFYLLWPLWQQKASKQNCFLLSLALFVCVASLAGYYHWGSAQQVAQAKLVAERTQQVKQELNQLGSTQKLIARFKQVVETNNDAKGWFLLAKLYSSNRDLDYAVNAFEKAHQLSPDNVEYSYHYAESLFFKHHRQLDSTAKLILQNIIEKNPNEMSALSLLAIDAYNCEYYQTALTYWQKIVPQISPESDEGKLILDMVARTRQKL